MSTKQDQSFPGHSILMPPEVKLKAAMWRKDMRNVDLARASGKGESDINKIISYGNKFTGEDTNRTARRLSTNMAKVFAPHLGVTVKWLFDGEHDIDDYLAFVQKDLERKAIEKAATPKVIQPETPLLIPRPVATQEPVAPPAPIGAPEPPRTTSDPGEDDARAMFENALIWFDAADVMRALETLKPKRKRTRGRETMVDWVAAPPASGQHAVRGVDDDGPEIQRPGAGDRG